MSQKDMRIRLVASPWMDARGGAEHSRIRIPKRARLHFKVRGSKVVIKAGDAGKGLDAKMARFEDCITLNNQLNNGVLSSDLAAITAFVTSKTRDIFLGGQQDKKDNELYLTDRIDALKIGADPEFALVNPHTLRFKYAEHIKTLTKEGLLGHDGPLAELRPPPAISTASLVENMKNILVGNKDSISDYLWVGGATYKNDKFPEDRVLHMGGHIHIGDPPLLPENIKNAIYQRIIQILDETIAIPLVKIDTPDPHLRRNTKYNGYGRYGRWGDQRPQVGRFEWRVPSGLWSTHPELAFAVLGTTKAVSEECYQRMMDNSFSMEYISAPCNRKGFLKEWEALAQEKAEKIVNESNPELVEDSLIKKMSSRLLGLENYYQYKDEIDRFISIVSMKDKDRNNISLDVRSNWLDGAQLINDK